jgi:UDP-N-acetyl-D-mannosaminuronate dehydrogenase
MEPVEHRRSSLSGNSAHQSTVPLQRGRRVAEAPRCKVAVVGLGYVGLPLALQFARSGADITGLDIDPVKINALNNSQSYIQHIPASDIREQVEAGAFI